MNRNFYLEDRFYWAHDQEEGFRAELTALCEEHGVDMPEAKFEEAVRMCVDGFKFAYPSEHKLVDMMSPDRELREAVLPDAMALMKRYRVDFATRERDS